MVGWLLLLISPLFALNIGAKSAILMDYTTGRILWAYNEKEKLPPASLTKILSAIVLLERGNLDQILTLEKDPPKGEPFLLGLKKGDKISLKNLLIAMLVRSANDAALVAAGRIGGSEGKFAQLMNEKAKELGANDSHFINCHGLPHPLHYSTAYDLALITRYALRNPTFASIVASPREELKWWRGNEEKTRRLENTNKLLSLYPYANGVKTGYTKEAGRCLSASARKGNWQLISVILNSPDVWKDAIALFEYGFNNFRPYFIAQKDIPIEYMKIRGNPPRVAILAKDDLLVIFPCDQQPSIKVEKTLYKDKAPIKEGEKIGVIKVEVNGEYWGETDLIAGNAVSPDLPQLFSSFSLKFSIFIFLLLILVRLWEESVKNSREKWFPRD